MELLTFLLTAPEARKGQLDRGTERNTAVAEQGVFHIHLLYLAFEQQFDILDKDVRGTVSVTVIYIQQLLQLLYLVIYLVIISGSLYDARTVNGYLE